MNPAASDISAGFYINLAIKRARSRQGFHFYLIDHVLIYLLEMIHRRHLYCGSPELQSKDRQLDSSLVSRVPPRNMDDNLRELVS
ncbi:hypothetical protein FKM82_011578 [Ascaphus truei]